MIQIQSRIDRLNVQFQRFEPFSITYPSFEWSDESPSWQECQERGRKAADIYCKQPGQKYLLVGSGLWQRMKSGKLKETLYEKPFWID